MELCRISTVRGRIKMRKLKFRVWDGEKFIKKMGIRADTGSITDLNEVFHNDAGANGEHFTAQQFTGLTDKEGKEVYKGDIVEVDRYYTREIATKHGSISCDIVEKGKETGKVFWADVFYCFQVSYEHLRYDDTEDISSGGRTKVIGNVFENPELIK